MDPEAVVTEQTESGKKLIEVLAGAGFDIRIAFWAKPTEAGKWYLYLVSPVVDANGPLVAYRTVFEVMRQLPDLWIDPLEIKVVGLNDSITKSVLEMLKPKSINGNSRPYPGMTRVGGSTLGGISIDGAYIYPVTQPVA